MTKTRKIKIDPETKLNELTREIAEHAAVVSRIVSFVLRQFRRKDTYKQRTWAMMETNRRNPFVFQAHIGVDQWPYTNQVRILWIRKKDGLRVSTEVFRVVYLNRDFNPEHCVVLTFNKSKPWLNILKRLMENERLHAPRLGYTPPNPFERAGQIKAVEKQRRLRARELAFRLKLR